MLDTVLDFFFSHETKKKKKLVYKNSIFRKSQEKNQEQLSNGRTETKLASYDSYRREV